MGGTRTGAFTRHLYPTRHLARPDVDSSVREGVLENLFRSRTQSGSEGGGGPGVDSTGNDTGTTSSTSLPLLRTQGAPVLSPYTRKMGGCGHTPQVEEKGK